MPEFTYTARNSEGKVVTETTTAQSREALGQILRGQGLLPTAIQENKKHNFSFDLSSMLKRVTLLEKLTFAKNLSVTLRAGLPVSKALNVITKQMDNKYFSQVISEIAHGVESGKSLSESMTAYPRIFSPIFTNMVKVGEQSGELEKSLDYLAKQISRDYNLVRRTRGALMYPAVVLVALLGIGYLMFTFVLPKLIVTFEEFNSDLPILTKIIINLVHVFSNYSLFVLLGTIGIIIGYIYWHRTMSGKQVTHKLILIFPVLSMLAKKINLARFTIIFGGLLKSGMPIVEALEVTGNTMSNLYYQRAILDASEKVRIGVDLVSSLERYPKLFTPMVTQMVQVGEESGTMEKVLDEVSNFYETEIDDTVKNLSSIIEPVLVLLIGAVVGLLAVGLIMPIYNLGQNI